MKKIFSTLTLLCLLLTAALPAAAADKTNVMVNAQGVPTTFGLASNGAYKPEHMWDGNIAYNKDDNATYCDFKTSASKANIMIDAAERYNVAGETGKDDSAYLAVFYVELDKVYTVDSFRFYGQQEGTTAQIDGFDLWVSETAEAGSWTKVYSCVEQLCGQKYQVAKATDELTSMYLEGDFTSAAKAKYIAFGLTEPRCQHIEKLADQALTPNANPNYFRITELEVFEGAAAPETTKAPETTAPPETTKAPETTAAPAATPATADATAVLAAMVVMAGVVLVSRRRAR